mmetsp:Transcript_37978/g.108483  ORF Transcript_37978/g.108483 Transcript_37978/m.108483 type:complete len:394 (-) Transcript_37978:367-1548(-)
MMASSRALNTCSLASSRCRLRSSTCRCHSDASCICFSTNPCSPRAPSADRGPPTMPKPPSAGLALRHQVLAAVSSCNGAACGGGDWPGTPKGGDNCCRGLDGERIPPWGSAARRRRPARDSRCLVLLMSAPVSRNRSVSWKRSRVFLLGDWWGLSPVLPMASALDSRMRSRVCLSSRLRSARLCSSASPLAASWTFSCCCCSSRASLRRRSSSRASRSASCLSTSRFLCFVSSTCAASALWNSSCCRRLLSRSPSSPMPPRTDATPAAGDTDASWRARGDWPWTRPWPCAVGEACCCAACCAGLRPGRGGAAKGPSSACRRASSRSSSSRRRRSSSLLLTPRSSICAARAACISCCCRRLFSRGSSAAAPNTRPPCAAGAGCETARLATAPWP